MNIREKLLAIQGELHAPKSQYNNFGKYKYRNCEDILEAIKPLCTKYKACLTIDDTLLEIGASLYIRATARISDTETKQTWIKATESNDGEVNCIQTDAYAQEAETQKGMNPAQITGSTSSYARKYALNGLFCIDDTKDDDFTNTNDSGKKDFVHKKVETGTGIVAMTKKTQPLATDFLQEMQSIKKILNGKTGDNKLYYMTLEESGYKKSNQIPKTKHKNCLEKFQNLIKEVMAL